MTTTSFIRITERSGTRLLILAVVTACAFVMTVFGAVLGMLIITPFFFYIPIIIAASWYPRRGVIFALGLGLIQLVLVYLFIKPDLPLLTYATATASFYVLVATAVVVSSLSGGLKDQEAKYHAIFDHSEAAVFLLSGDSELRILEVNRRGREITGYPPGVLEGSSFLRVADKDEIEEWLHKLNDDGVASDYESSLVKRVGGSTQVLLSAARIPGGQIVCIAMDITARKRSEEEIFRRNRELSVINQVISMMSGARTVPNLIEDSLTKVCDLLGFSSGMVYLVNPHRNLIELQFHLRIPISVTVPTYYEKEQYPFAKVLGGSAVYPEGSGMSSPSAVIPLVCDREVIGSMHLFKGGSPGISPEEKVILESIGKEVGCTIRKLTLSEDLAVANQRANLYLDILVHDVNNANMTSLGYGELLRDMVEGPAQEITGKLIDVVRKSGEIVRNLETIRKIHERMPELKPVDLDYVIRNEVHLFPGDTPVEYTPCSFTVYADDLLSEVFSNLFDNCRKFGGKDISVSCTVREIGDEVIVSVADNGPGIPDDMKPLIFERFQRGTTKRTGKGLGLYIVKTLVERYGGRIRVENRVPDDYSRGVVISFTLRKYPVIG
ncbi:MAG: PAS domain-containing sensor histidine kinase [Methanoregulaceae archaeon]|nr:PAS domain-containing sensor histidine kinase [Methanoregulaceae archaeon]